MWTMDGTKKKNILSDVILTQKEKHGMYSPIGGY